MKPGDKDMGREAEQRWAAEIEWFSVDGESVVLDCAEESSKVGAVKRTKVVAKSPDVSVAGVEEVRVMLMYLRRDFWDAKKDW
jgi:hypothetical protein